LSDVLGIGNAIVDVLSHTTDDLLERYDLAKGSMTLIDASQAMKLYRELSEPVQCSGGSAANTMVGLASLGGEAAYVGKVRDDPLGALFTDGIRRAGVSFETTPASEGPPTGRCLVLVTPDAQRTMLTFLGSSANLGPGDIDARAVEEASIVYLEGYLWDPPPAKQAFLEAARIAHHAGRKVALTLSDGFCVDRHRTEFLDLVARHVDILFANEDEICSLYESGTFEEAVERLGHRCEVAALTRGEKGSVIVSGERRIEVAAEPVDRVVDTTGAGDLYAAGFLYGLTQGRELAECGRLGGVAAADVIRHFGARPSESPVRLADGGQLNA